MENKINIARLLKDCPKDMELDCTLFDDVYFDSIDEVCDIIKCYIKDSHHKIGISFDKYGHYSNIRKAKCVIFPKGKTTWEGFQRPFKDGEVVAYDNPYRNYSEIFIFKDKKENNTLSNCYLMFDGDKLYIEEDAWYVTRLATEEEKSKLFQAIKDNGYKWNSETKTLEKLIEPKFKVADIIQDIDTYKVKITEVNIEDECYGYESMIAKGIGSIGFNEQDNWELAPDKFDINTLKPFDKVLVRLTKYNVWNATFFSHYDKEVNYGCYPFVTTSSKSYSMCIPYEGNEHLLGTTNDCDDFYKTW